MVTVVSDELEIQIRGVGRIILRAPFTRRAWSELLYMVTGGLLAAVGLAFIGITMAAGVVLAITFFGLAILGLSLRGARGLGGIYRSLARRLLDEQIEDPAPFSPRPGFLGWLQSVLRDGTAWRAAACVAIKVPLAILALFTAFAVCFDAFTCLVFPLTGGSQPPVFGLPLAFFHPNSGFDNGGPGGPQRLGVFVLGLLLLFAAPWAVRGIVAIDRSLMRALLGPDATALRVRSLEEARTQTVDASAATLRRIDRDLHDGTQAQLVAVALRLGMAKEKLAAMDDPDLDQVRDLVDDAHRGAKETIVELRDLARGIHPPALDIGLEGALATLAARSTVPTELTLDLHDRPTPAIEAIAYFCVAELLANVAQHAQASAASIRGTQHGRWLRLVVRDDGTGGAQPSTVGSSSSGLSGLAERVHAVDGRFDITSPPRGPTVVTVDLPLHA